MRLRGGRDDLELLNGFCGDLIIPAQWRSVSQPRANSWVGGGTEDESMLAIPINPHWTAVHPVNVEGLPGMVYIKTAAHSTTKYEVGRVRVRASANPMTVVRTAISSPK